MCESPAFFVRAILDHPADVVPRLVFADWLEEHGDPDRAEFIRVQCQLTDLGPDHPRRTGLIRRQHRLLKQHADRWRLELPGWARGSGAKFRRGLVARIRADADAFLRGAEALFRVAPVEEAHLTLRPGHDFDRLINFQWLSRLTVLRLEPGVTDEAAAVLAGSPHLRGLEDLSLAGNRVGSAGAAALLTSASLPALRRVDLRDNWIDAAAARRLTERFGDRVRV